MVASKASGTYFLSPILDDIALVAKLAHRIYVEATAIDAVAFLRESRSAASIISSFVLASELTVSADITFLRPSHVC